MFGRIRVLALVVLISFVISLGIPQVSAGLTCGNGEYSQYTLVESCQRYAEDTAAQKLPFGQVGILQTKAEALTTGTDCGGKNMVQMDGTTDDNMETWIAKEQPLVNTDFLVQANREVIIGWHFKGYLTYDAVTVQIVHTGGEAGQPIIYPTLYYTTMYTAQGYCAGIHFNVPFGGLLTQQHHEFSVNFVFSGAAVEVKNTSTKTVTTSVWAEYDYQWSLGISVDGVSLTTPKFSFGGSYTYTSTKGYEVTAVSYSKGVHIFGAGNGGEATRLNRVGTAVYQTGPAICAAHYATVAPPDAIDCAPVGAGADFSP